MIRTLWKMWCDWWNYEDPEDPHYIANKFQEQKAKELEGDDSFPDGPNAVINGAPAFLLTKKQIDAQMKRQMDNPYVYPFEENTND